MVDCKSFDKKWNHSQNLQFSLRTHNVEKFHFSFLFKLTFNNCLQVIVNRVFSHFKTIVGPPLAFLMLKTAKVGTTEGSLIFKSLSLTLNHITWLLHITVLSGLEIEHLGLKRIKRTKCKKVWGQWISGVII